MLAERKSGESAGVFPDLVTTMNVVEQRPGKLRITTDHSFPRTLSLHHHLEFNPQLAFQASKQSVWRDTGHCLGPTGRILLNTNGVTGDRDFSKGYDLSKVCFSRSCET